MFRILCSVTFLPVLEDRCTFNLLVYADRAATVPSEWIDSDPKYIENAEQVRLRSFNTGVHKVDTLVSYKYD
jgi:mitotic spindle assembly checkpoint protein MAD2